MTPAEGSFSAWYRGSSCPGCTGRSYRAILRTAVRKAPGRTREGALGPRDFLDLFGGAQGTGRPNRPRGPPAFQGAALAAIPCAGPTVHRGRPRGLMIRRPRRERGALRIGPARAPGLRLAIWRSGPTAGSITGGFFRHQILLAGAASGVPRALFREASPQAWPDAPSWAAVVTGMRARSNRRDCQEPARGNLPACNERVGRRPGGGQRTPGAGLSIVLIEKIRRRKKEKRPEQIWKNVAGTNRLEWLSTSSSHLLARSARAAGPVIGCGAKSATAHVQPPSSRGRRRGHMRPFWPASSMAGSAGCLERQSGPGHSGRKRDYDAEGLRAVHRLRDPFPVIAPT